MSMHGFRQRHRFEKSAERTIYTYKNRRNMVHPFNIETQIKSTDELQAIHFIRGSQTVR